MSIFKINICKIGKFPIEKKDVTFVKQPKNFGKWNVNLTYISSLEKGLLAHAAKRSIVALEKRDLETLGFQNLMILKIVCYSFYSRAREHKFV